jgi:6-pyruvoyltetrahydropterin/6-carboxytetrahydropterin synthase
VSGPFELERQYRFEAAHFLPHVADSHPCRRMHGHSYVIGVTVAGYAGEESGWVVDFADIDAVIEPLCDQLDHRLLNEIDGLENPTSEVLAEWFWDRSVSGLPGLFAIRVAETADASCTFRGAS